MPTGPGSSPTNDRFWPIAAGGNEPQSATSNIFTLSAFGRPLVVAAAARLFWPSVQRDPDPQQTLAASRLTDSGESLNIPFPHKADVLQGKMPHAANRYSR